MTEARVPTSVVVSVGLHAGALALFVVLSRQAPQQAARVVEGVDLLIQSPKAPAQPAAVVKPELSTMDFLKMALPSIPRPAALAVAEPVLQPHRVALAEPPKLSEASRKELGPKLDALDLSRERAATAKLDVKIGSRRQASQALAALPRLEDVGRRRVRNLPQALQLEERRREAVAEQGLPALDAKPTARRTALAAVEKLDEAAPPPPPSETRRGLSAVLPSRLVMEERPQAVIAPKLEKLPGEAPKLERRRAQAAAAAAPKAVEIEGPLADRKVAAYLVPKFPSWLQNQGILEADVSIRFTVDEDGGVQPDMRVTSSSGYGRLDKLAMDSLRQWRFVPKPGAGVQWGVITFRFVLE